MVEITKELLALPRTSDNVSEIFRLNKGLVGKQLMKFGLVSCPDAISLGYEALFHAIVTYDGKKAAFSTYATTCIYNKLGDYVRHLNTQINLSTVSYEAFYNGEDCIVCDDNASSSLGDTLAVTEIKEAFRACHCELRNETQYQIIAVWATSEFSIPIIDIAKTVGCSQPYVTQVLQKFKRALKERLDERNCESNTGAKVRKWNNS